MRPTEIQEKSIPSLLDGSDMIGIAATGTGKTGAFLIPIIHQMLKDKNSVVPKYFGKNPEIVYDSLSAIDLRKSIISLIKNVAVSYNL